jgi:hypothetical protein
MKKHLFVFACLALPLAALASNDKGGAKPPAKAASAAAHPASRPAPYVKSADESRANVQVSKMRKSDMGACQKEAADKGLHDVERKQFLVTCMNGQ